MPNSPLQFKKVYFYALAVFIFKLFLQSPFFKFPLFRKQMSEYDLHAIHFKFLVQVKYHTAFTIHFIICHRETRISLHCT